MSLIPFLVAVGNVFCIQILLPFKKDKPYVVILFSAGIINIILAFSLTPYFMEVGMATASLISELFVTLSMIIVTYSYNLIPFTNVFGKA